MKDSTIRTAHYAAVLVAAVAGTSCLPLGAERGVSAGVVWIDPSDPTGIGNDANAATNLNGAYGNAAHWNPAGIPGLTANLVLNAPGYPSTPYTVTLNADETANSMSVSNPVTLSLGQFHLLLNQATASGSSASLIINNNASLTIDTGYLLPQSLDVGTASTATPLANTFLEVNGTHGNTEVLVHSGSTINVYQTISLTNGATFDMGDGSLVNLAPDIGGGGYNTGSIVVDGSFFYMGDGATILGGSVIVRNGGQANVRGNSLTFDSLYYNSDLNLVGDSFIMNLQSSLLDPHHGNQVIPTTITGAIDANIGQLNIINSVVQLTPDSGNTFTPFTIVGNTAVTISNAAVTTGLLDLDGDGAPGTGSTGSITQSFLAIHDDMWVGELGNASINASNTVINIDGAMILGDQEGSAGTLVLDGPTTVVNTGLNPSNDHYGYGLGHLIVGSFGAGQLTISGGARFNVGSGWDANVGLGSNFVTGNNDFTGGTGTLTITGAWTNTSGNVFQSMLDINGGDGRLFAGVYAYSMGVVNITNGGLVTGSDGEIGTSANAVGIVTVDGGYNSTANNSLFVSQWIANGTIYVGDAGTGTLTISNSAAVSSGNDFAIGNNTGSTGAVVVSTFGSLEVDTNMDSTKALWVGASGTGSLDILNGGGVIALSDAYVGAGVTGTGEITVDEMSGLAVEMGLNIGYLGRGSLTITNNGTVLSASAIVGFGANSFGQVLVDNSVWNVTSAFTLGQTGHATMAVQNEAAITSGAVGMAMDPLSGGTLTVNSASWAATGALTVGGGGTGILTIQNDGFFSNTDATLGNAASGSGIVTVDGSGTQWQSSGVLIVGNSGNGTLSISNAGQATALGGIFLGQNAGATGQVTISGTGSVLTSSSQMAVGMQGSGSLTLQGGAKLSASAPTSSFSHSALVIGEETTGVGVMSVSGAGTQVTLTGHLAVGFGANGSNTSTGGFGTLSILNGALVSDANGYIGRYAGSSGNVTVSGAGAGWTNTGALFIAANDTANNNANQVLAAGVGTLTISTGGSVTAAAPSVIGAGGLLTLQGGSYSAPSTNLSGAISGNGQLFGPAHRQRNGNGNGRFASRVGWHYG